jgi:RNA polymerase sigma-70 factor (ECF subfamily)
LKVREKEANERLLVEAAQKDPARFTELYEANFERVYAFVSRRVPSRADTEDLTAEIFQHAFEDLARFEWRGVPFVAWLYRIAANAIADRWQRLSRESGNPAAENTPGHREDLDVEKIERRAQIFRNVANLPAEQRRVIEMRFAEEKSIREIAKELRRTAGAVKQLQFRGIRTLRAQMNSKDSKKSSGSNG